MSFGIGQPVPRSEDPRFLTGRGAFVDDIALPRMAHAAIVQSPHAHALIRSIDTAAALAAPGVIAVLTGRDAAADGLGGIAPNFTPQMMRVGTGYLSQQPVLAHGEVRHVGERVAMVIAGTRAEAQDAAGLIAIDWEPLPAVTDTRAAIADGAPQVHDDAPANTASEIRFGDAAEADAAFARAAFVARVRIRQNRITACSMETRGAIGAYEDSAGYTLYTSCQNPHLARSVIAQMVLKVPESRVRVVARDVGGGFGMKGTTYPEEALVLWAARRTRRPVKWIGERGESMLGDTHARDMHLDGALALDADGKFLALRWRALQNAGAYIPGSGYIPLVFAVRIAQSVYDVPAFDCASRFVLTHTTPTAPYRGAGRPEGIFAFERLIDEAARITGIDRIELRRRNLIRPEAMPFTTHTRFVYDSGEFETVLDRALGLADRDGFAARRAASAAKGLCRGLGIACYIDDCGNFNDRAEIRFDPSGSVTIVAGTFSHGQGHATVYAQMVSDWLGVPFESVAFEQGDTATVPFGRGTVASRSMVIGGSALRAAADAVIEKGRRFAAHLLEAPVEDVEFSAGRFAIAGTDRSLGMTEVARAAFRPAGMPAALGLGLDGTGAFGIAQPSFPNGCHVCEVEIDPETGRTAIDRYVVADDIGVVLNPLLAEGQIHGGIAQGIGQALLEDIRFDAAGQNLTGSLMDYALPRADDLPSFEAAFVEVPCRSNPIGVKGAGEGGTVGATPAVVSAILDALAPLGVSDIDMPATPERIWRAIRDAGRG
jgi:carbon-monoxide dehydrogenase large subunit